jgi:hypothetical protein
MDSPNNGDWAVSAMAPAQADTRNPALTVRSFIDAGIETGVGFLLRIQPGQNNLTMRFATRPESPPTGTAANVALRMYNRLIAPGQPTVGGWSGRTLSPISYAASSIGWQENAITIGLGTSGPTVMTNAISQFEFTRVSTASGLAGNMDLLAIIFETTP